MSVSATREVAVIRLSTVFCRTCMVALNRLLNEPSWARLLVIVSRAPARALMAAAGAPTRSSPVTPSAAARESAMVTLTTLAASSSTMNPCDEYEPSSSVLVAYIVRTAIMSAFWIASCASVSYALRTEASFTPVLADVTASSCARMMLANMSPSAPSATARTPNPS